MEESKRQRQIAGVIMKEMNEIFQHLGLTMIDGGMLSISDVKVTPDLLEARIYLSLFQVADKKIAFKKIEDQAWEIKKELASRIKHQVRRIPVIKYFTDDTLDNVFHMEELFKKIKEDEDASNDQNQD